MMKNNLTYKKRNADLTTVITILCLTLAFALTILLSFGARFVFRPQLDSSFWGDLAVSSALCVYCLYFGVPEGKNFYQRKENGRYQNALNQFKDMRSQASGKDNAFTQWLERYYQKNKLDYFRSILSSHGSISPFVLDLDFHEIDLLKNPYKKNWDDTEFKGRKDTYFRSLDDEQIDLIKRIFKGKVNFSRIPDDFFKTMNGKVITSEYASQAEANRKHTAGYVLMIMGRLVLIFAIAFVFNAFAIQVSQAGSGEEVMQRTISTISRLWTMASSFAYGFSLGRVMTMNDSATIEYKARVNKEFLDDKAFKPLNEEEQAKKEYDEYQKKIEEARKNVVTPVVELTYNKGNDSETRGDGDGRDRDKANG